MLLLAVLMVICCVPAWAADPAECKDGSCAPEPAKKVAAPPSTEPPPPVPASGHNIGTDVLKALIESRIPMVVLDARTGKYDDGIRIKGAKALSPTAPVEEVLKVAPSRQMLVVTYCGSLKCPASAALAKHLHELGFKNVLEYPFGIKGWREAGLPVDEPAK